MTEEDARGWRDTAPPALSENSAGSGFESQPLRSSASTILGIALPPQFRGLQAGQDWHSINSAASGIDLSDKETEESGDRNNNLLFS